ncbi:MAG: lipopolysaccharide biosynthesis protein [Candidatus Thorarchaeota archaeon]
MEDTKDERVLRKRFGHHAVAGFVSAVVIRLLALLLVKILSVYLSKTDYGTYVLWMALVLLISTFSTSPFSATLWRYLQKKHIETPRDASKLITQSLVGPIVIIAVIFSSLFFTFFFFGIRIIEDPLYQTTLFIAVILTVFYVLKEIILVISGTEQNSREVFMFNLSFGLLSVTGASLLAILTGSFLFALIGLSVGYSVPVFVSLALKLKQYRLTKFTKKEVKLVTEYGGPLIVVHSAGSTIVFITSLAASIWIGLSSVGTLNIAQTIAVLPSFVIAPAIVAYYTYLVLTFETSDFEKGNTLTTKFVEMFISLVTPVVLLIIAFSPFLIEFISTSEYLDAIIIIPFTVVAAALISLSQFWKFRIQLVHKTHLVASVYIVSFVTLLISLIIFQSLGLVGIGVAILIHALTVLMGMYIMGNRNMPITLRRSYFASWLLSLSVLLILFTFFELIGFSAMLASLIASGVYLISLVLTRGLKISDIKYIIRIIFKRS